MGHGVPDIPHIYLETARAWLAQDPDPVTRAQTERLLERVDQGDGAALDELKRAFGERLGFGTAGLRGELGAGPGRMNRVLVAQAAAGIARYLTARESRPSVVIGYDGRHNSAIFARDSAEILAGAGIDCVLLGEPLPTPVLAFAVRDGRFSAGIMVTASHNPASDNGYKVYLGGPDEGSQLVAPADSDIAAQISQLAATYRFADFPRGEYRLDSGAVPERYLSHTVGLLPRAATAHRWVYTPMHGVGKSVFLELLGRAGYPAPTVVASQAEIDPDFPTVAYPNPEEPGALDAAIGEAQAVNADFIVAHDPDADRLAIAIRADDGYRRLSGNEVGILLGWSIARRAAERGAEVGTLACSLVSSPALAEIARHYNLNFVETLTGFKWISRAPGLLFGFEEALGYLVNPGTVRDKDGISAAAAFLALVSELDARGSSVSDYLDEFVLTFGAFSSSQISLRFADTGVIAQTMRQLRREPPARLADLRVTQIDDLIDGFAALPPSDVLRIWLADGSRVVVRPSGTEPKLKVYIDSVWREGTVAERRERANRTVTALESAMRQLVQTESASTTTV